ncbi:Quinol monooxygenase YgiN [Chryseolinea serpens]|uniref:Quinol monooxygenase YgiN n=1 Tax=Chryseolinea serpens TaxID=947013 RepID=A0A1M5KHW9_9BACT|nr:putative quinol monooxygenase [Chryseolinea serpens]SHG51783.1 Quinol monooxygenase YgiN [Chryseolinea serpens]
MKSNAKPGAQASHTGLAAALLIIFNLSFTPTQAQNSHAMTESKTLYGFSGSFKTKPGKGPELIAILLQAAEDVQTAKGCHLYIISQDEKDPDTVHVFETWDSREDHDNSLKLEDSKDLIAQAMPLLDGKPQGMSLKVFGGAGLK